MVYFDRSRTFYPLALVIECQDVCVRDNSSSLYNVREIDRERERERGGGEGEEGRERERERERGGWGWGVGRRSSSRRILT